MDVENFTFHCGAETLAATIHWNTAKNKPTVLSLHGGGTGTRTRAAYLLAALAAAGHSCLSFDHSGQGDSSGELQKSSMQKRLQEALAATAFMDRTKPLTVMGSSMGGPTAMALTRHCSIQNLILFCPALYAREAFDVPFDAGFTGILRRENSFLHTDTALLENYRGNFLHIIGDADTVIPPGVTQTYQKHVINAASCEFVTVKDAPHLLHPFFQAHGTEQAMIIKKILALLE